MNDSELKVKNRELDLKEVELGILRDELELKRESSQGDAWKSPIILAILAAALGAFSNAGLQFLSAKFDREASDEAFKKKLQIEKVSAENSRITELIKSGNPDTVENNLNFLIGTGLLSDEDTIAKVKDYYHENELQDRPGTIISKVAPCNLGENPEQAPTFYQATNIEYELEDKLRDLPVSHSLMRALSEAVREIDEGMIILVQSAGQPSIGTSGRRTGGSRHDVNACGYGQAVDFYLSKNGTDLPINGNTEIYQKVSAKLMKEWSGQGVELGYIMHIGGGTPGVWGDKGKPGNAPIWLKSNFEKFAVVSN